MSHRTDHDRVLTLNKAASEATYWTTAPHTVSHLRAAIDLHLVDGLAGTAYDRTGTGGHSDTSPTEATAETRTWGDRANEDLGALDGALDQLARATATLARLRADYPLEAMPGRGRLPGIGPCPTGKCRGHWAAGIEQAARKGGARCKRCADFHRVYGVDMPPQVIQTVHDLGGTQGSHGPGVWTQPERVRRAWSSCGWNPGPPPHPKPETWEAIQTTACVEVTP